MSNKENIRKRCNCQCQETLINLKEDNRQFELKYNEIRGEGERLYQQYEIKSSKLREALEINHQLTDENQQLHDQNQSLAERLVQVLQEKSLVDHEKQQEMDRLLNSFTLERQAMAQRFSDLESKNTELVTELSDLKRAPPLHLEIKVELPAVPTAIAASAAEMNIVDRGIIDTMSKDELREHIDRVCVSNEILRDEVRSLESKIRSCEQRCSAQSFTILEKDAMINSLNEKLERLLHLEDVITAKSSEVEDVSQKYQQLSYHYGRSQETINELTAQIEQLLQQLEGERAQNSVSLKQMENDYKQKEDMAGKLIQDLERKMLEVQEQSSVFIHSQSQIAVLKEQDQQLRNQVAQLQLAYKNAQDDLMRIYTKHKKDLSHLEETYRHGEYVERYEKLVLQCRTFESLCSAISKSSEDLTEAVQLIESACVALKAKKEYVQRFWKRVNAQHEVTKAAREAETCFNRNCDNLRLELASLKNEVSSLRTQKEDLLRINQQHVKDQHVSDCKSVIFSMIFAAILQSESKSSLSNTTDQHLGLKLQLNAELKALEQLEGLVESEQAEVSRLKLENERLTRIAETERQINQKRGEEFEAFTRTAESKIDSVMEENKQLKSLRCIEDSQRQQEIVSMHSRIAELNLELDIRQKELFELLQSNQKLEDHNTNLLRDFETLKDICKDRDAEIESLRSEIASLSSRITWFENSLTEAETSRLSMKSESKLAKEEIEVLRSANMDLSIEIEDLHRACQKDKELFTERISNLQDEREILESRLHELKLKDNARQGQIEAMESQKLKIQLQLKTAENANLKLHKQIEDIRTERDRLQQRLSEMVQHKDKLLQEMEKFSQQPVDAHNLYSDNDYEALKQRYESKILKLKHAMLDYKTRGDRKITSVVQDLSIVSRRCEQLELCFAEIGRRCPQNAIIQSLVEEVARSKQKLKIDEVLTTTSQK